ncbi:SIR2 family NAD-dependent protein deacylase [Thermocrinis sp.]
MKELFLALTGAGISAESGIPTFRGEGGLWKQFRPEELATPKAFAKDPKSVWEWYDWRRRIISKAEPNRAHLLLVELEQRLENFFIITQNVDGLHQKAGSKKVIELHGNIWRVRCLSCRAEYELYETPLKEIPPRCRYCGGLLRPAVVWFGESLPEDALTKSFELSQNCSLFLVIGTSGMVYPAGYLPFIAKQRGAKIVEINPERTAISDIADIVIREKATKGLEQFLAKMLNF